MTALKILKLVIWVFGTETFKKLLKMGVMFIVTKTKTGIDDELANVFFTSVVKSKHNSVTEAMVADAKKVLQGVKYEDGIKKLEETVRKELAEKDRAKA